MLGLRMPRAPRRLAAVLVALVALATLFFAGYRAPATSSARASGGQGSVTLRDLQAMIFVWASGTPAVQQMDQQTCAQVRLTAGQCASVSVAVRAAWLDLGTRDPAALGRVGAAPNLAGRAVALGTLAGHLDAVTGGRTGELLAATHAAYTAITQPRWILDHALGGRQSLPAGTALIWATSYSQKTKLRQYVAMPDVYIKYANLGSISSIPSFYQPYYAPAGTTTHWTVNISTPDNTHSAANVLIIEVGPWNEDDNWWDPNGSSTSLAASCPVSTNRFADATSNALVDGICPNNGKNLRRIYYYLLYTHNGLPFFQVPGYAPSGNFKDGGPWPTALGLYCSEAAGASVNNDGITCASATPAYNVNNGGWLRDGTYNSPVLNQSSIDLSPGVDKALGWVYPSSGLVDVYVGGLP